MDLLFTHYDINEKDWEPVWALTISPRGKAKDNSEILEAAAADYINRVAARAGVHIAPVVYRGDKETDSREHLHITLFVERGKRLPVLCLALEAFKHRVFFRDAIVNAIKPIEQYEGWREYKKSKHKVSFMWISCPRKRKACKGGKRKGRKVSCAIQRGMVKRLKKVA